MTEPDRLGERPSSPEFDKNRLSFDVWLGAHSFENDFGALGPLLNNRDYDIWIPEAIGATSEQEELFREVAKGNRQAYRDALSKSRPGGPFLLLFKHLYGSHLKIFFADYTQQQFEADEDLAFVREPVPLTQLNTLDGAMNFCLYQAQRQVRSYEKRDENIANNIESNMAAFIDDHPKLSDRQDIRALVSIGLLHINLPDRLAAAGYKVRPIGPMTSPQTNTELVQKLQRGQEIDRGLLVRSALELFIGHVVTHKDGLVLDEIIRTIIDDISEEEASVLIANHRVYGDEMWRRLVDRMVGKLGIRDPDFRLLVD